jgi:hypothetical protein
MSLEYCIVEEGTRGRRLGIEKGESHSEPEGENHVQ